MNSVPDTTPPAIDATAAIQRTSLGQPGPKDVFKKMRSVQVKIRRYTEFSSELVALAAELKPEAGPTIAELANIAKFRHYNLRIIAIVVGERCVALSCCRIREVIFAGLPIRREYICLGDEFYDYNTLYWEPEYRTTIFEAIVADAIWERADWIYLKRLLVDKSASECLGQVTAFTSQIYNSELDPDPYQSLLRKKSLRRHVNKCKRELPYSCKHLKGAAITHHDLRALKQLHIETRRFNGTRSAFLDSSTYDTYASNLEQRVFTGIYAGDEPVALHYGMHFGDTLIWHTPVVNIKFLAYSPLEVLLAETLEYCRSHQIKTLDFGIGDETYKNRFSNHQRRLVNWSFPLSLKGRAALFLKRSGTISRLQCMLPAVATACGKLATAASLLPSRTRTRRARSRGDSSGPAASSLQLASINRFDALVDLFRANGLNIKKEHYKRIRNQHRFYALRNANGEMVSSLWAVQHDAVKPGEIMGLVVGRRDSELLYDFMRHTETDGPGSLEGMLSALPCGKAPIAERPDNGGSN